MARPLNAEYYAAADADALLSRRDTLRAVNAGKTSAQPSFLVSPDEDEGVEKMPSETVRSKGDKSEAEVSKRVPRNMLPFVGETADGDVWARTAEFRGMLRQSERSQDASKAADRRLMRELYDVSARLGHIRNTKETLVENYCGSCGAKRQERHAITKQPAIMYTHHPTAPVLHGSPAFRLRVCACHNLCIHAVLVEYVVH